VGLRSIRTWAGALAITSFLIHSPLSGEDDPEKNIQDNQVIIIIIIMAESYINAAARESGAAAELAASRKEEKYAVHDGGYIFEPIAIESLGVLAHQPTSSCLISEGKFQRVQVQPMKRAFCSKDVRCSCNVSLPYCFMTVCR